MTAYLISLSVLICAVLLIRGIFRKTISPRAIYALWLVVVLRMCLPFTLFEVFVQIPDFPQYEKTEQQQETVIRFAEAAEREVIETIVREPVQSPVPPAKEPEKIILPDEPDEVNEEETTADIGRIFMTIWLTGSAVMAVWFSITGGIYHHRLRKDRRLHTELGRIKVYVSESAGVPCIAGLVPSIYITPSAAGSESESIIMHHEYTHLCHGDHIWSLFRVLALTAFWWSPLVWIAAAFSRQDAELACDDAVVSGMTEENRLRYARILLDTIPQKHRYAVGFGSAPMKERILMLTEKRKNRWICLILAVVLSVSAVGCSFGAVRDKKTEQTDEQAENSAEQQTQIAETNETLKIPEISLTQVEKLPRSEAAALFSASPVGGNPTIYFFENDLSFYIRMYTSVDAECIYYSGSLTLPEGFSGGRVVRASGGGGSGETFVTVCAEQDGRTVYLDYFINYNNEPFLPDFVYVLDDQQITELRDVMNNMPIHRDIYLCDDVYRSADTPTHGSADVFIPIALTDYTVTECQILLCEDGCDPTDVVSRAFWGYGPAWRIDQYEEYRAADGWRFDTRRYINEVPEDIREQMADQGAPDSVIWPREYLYLVTLESGKYAFIVIEPNEPDGNKPTDEIEQVNGFIRNMEVILEVPVSEEELAEEIIMPVEEVIEETAEEIIEEPNPDWLVDEDSAPYTYTREEWIQYSLYTDFGFRDPVDVSALTDDELTAYMADAYQCALDIYFLFHVSSDRMYARNLWNSTMPHVEIDGRYYSQMFNPVFPTLADLESYMNGVLSHDLTKQLLSMEMFIDYEGELWGMMGARGTDISKKTVGFSVTSRTDTEIIYTAEVEVREYDLSAEKPDYVEYHDFTYSLTEDGWRWTDFYLYN